MMDFLYKAYEWYTNTAWHKWWMDTIWKPTWTKLVSSIYGIPALLVTVGEEAGKFFQDNTIQQYMNYLDIPNWVPMALAGLALMHYVASGRKVD